MARRLAACTILAMFLIQTLGSSPVFGYSVLKTSVSGFGWTERYWHTMNQGSPGQQDCGYYGHLYATTGWLTCNIYAFASTAGAGGAWTAPFVAAANTWTVSDNTLGHTSSQAVVFQFINTQTSPTCSPNCSVDLVPWNLGFCSNCPYALGRNDQSWFAPSEGVRWGGIYRDYVLINNNSNVPWAAWPAAPTSTQIDLQTVMNT